MKVKITRWIEEVVDLPESMFEKTGTFFEDYSEYELTEESSRYMDENNILRMEDMEGRLIAEACPD